MPRTDQQLRGQVAALTAFLRVYGGGADDQGRAWDDADRAAFAPGGSFIHFSHDPRRRGDASFCGPVVARLDYLAKHYSYHLAQNIQPALRRLTPAQAAAVRAEYLTGTDAARSKKASDLGVSSDAYRKRLDAALVNLARLLWTDDGAARPVDAPRR